MVPFFFYDKIDTINYAISNAFNDIRCARRLANGELEYIQVPFVFGPTSKVYSDRKENYWVDSQNKEHNQRYVISKPRLALKLDNIVYDADRAVSNNQWANYKAGIINPTDDLDSVLNVYQPTPYSLTYTLSIQSDIVEYTHQILEQIMPFFNPSIVIRIKEFSFLNVERDCVVKLDGVQILQPDEMNDGDKRYYNATMNLTVPTWFHRPVVTSKTIQHVTATYTDEKDIIIGETQTDGVLLTSAGIPISGAVIPDTFNTSGVGHNFPHTYNWYSTNTI